MRNQNSNNEVVVVPSTDLPPIDMIPRVQILENDLKAYVKKKKPKNESLSTI